MCNIMDNSATSIKREEAFALEHLVVWDNRNTNVTWDNVYGLTLAKQALLNLVYQQSTYGYQLSSHNVLLHGPPGTGKTLLVNALCSKVCNFTFIRAHACDLYSRQVGESFNFLCSLFKLAKSKQPSIVFFDDLEFLGSCQAGKKIAVNLVAQMQQCDKNENISIIGATNAPWKLEDSFICNFKSKIYCPLPDSEACILIFKKQFESEDHALNDKDFQEIGTATNGYSGADVNVLANDARMYPVREIMAATHFKVVPVRAFQNADKLECELLTPCQPDENGAIEMHWTSVPADKLKQPVVTMEMVRLSLANCRPSIHPDELKKFEEFSKLAHE